MRLLSKVGIMLHLYYNNKTSIIVSMYLDLYLHLSAMSALSLDTFSFPGVYELGLTEGRTAYLSDAIL